MSVSTKDEALFLKACDEIVQKDRAQNGIGTLSEKTLHAVLKRFYEPDITHQEIPVEGYVADIFRDNEIIEIQTQNFNAMRKKLDTFLPLYPVTIVYPILHQKWLNWIDDSTGEVVERRKSPKKGAPQDAFFELYKIKSYLTHPNLHLCLALIDAEEYRLLNGWNKTKKKGSTRYDRIPVKLVDEYYIGSTKDYGCLIPDTLPDIFTTKDFAKCGKLSPKSANLALNVLYHTQVVERIGKEGNRYLYKVAL